LSNPLDTQQNPFLGSRPQGQPTAGVVDLTILDAIDRGLKYNLGLYLTERGTEQARAAQLRTRSELLPSLDGRVSWQEQQINLAALGIPANSGFPSVVGPFGVMDARALLTESLINVRNIENNRAAREDIKAAQFNYRNARDLVVLVVGGTYLESVSSAARVDAVKAQVETARSLYQRAVDMKNAGMVAGIDVLRANVEFQAQQQRLLAAQNQFERDKLQLARVIGLPVGQQFRLTDQIPYAPGPDTTLEAALQRAFENRSDYKALLSSVRSAELSRKAASAQRLPSVNINADYGDIGQNFANSHGTFTAGATLKFPIFEGGRIRADEQQADSVLKQRQAQADDLRSRIEFEVRTAMLDLHSASDQVAVAQNALGLAREQVVQAQDRFGAGVTNNIEVVQAQDALAATNENYIGALFSFNFAKLQLARAIGIAEDATKAYLGGK
jgi:outer membrane protein TolC